MSSTRMLLQGVTVRGGVSAFNPHERTVFSGSSSRAGLFPPVVCPALALGRREIVATLVHFRDVAYVRAQDVLC